MMFLCLESGEKAWFLRLVFFQMDKYNWRLILSFNCCDVTDNNWAQAFQVREPLLIVRILQSIQNID